MWEDNSDEHSEVIKCYHTVLLDRCNGELTRSLCGRDQTQPRKIRLCSPSPPGHVDAVCMARSWSPGKRALSLYHSNSGSLEAVIVPLIVIY